VDETVIIWDVSECSKPPIPEFFAILNKEAHDQLPNFKLLDQLSTEVTDIT